MMYSIKNDLEIIAPKAEVWAVLADFNNVYTWAPSVTHSAAINEKDNEIGAGRSCKIEGFGEIEETITLWQENQSFTFKISDLGPLTKATSRWSIQAINEQKTRLSVTFNYQIRFGVLGKVMHKLIMRNKLEKGLSGTTNALKKRVETGELIRPLNRNTLSAA